MALQIRRGTEAERAAMSASDPAAGELLYITDTDDVYVGDGSTAGGVQVGGSGSGDPDQNLWETIDGDTGSTAADSTTDTLTIAGGDGITTAMSGDTLTVTNSNHSAVAANTTHSGGDGSDHANVATNTTHSGGDGSDHADVATNTSKLAGIETGADVTDATNVAAAGAIMDSDISEGEGFVRKTGAGAYEAIKTNIGAAVGPTVNDDSGSGYAVGSRWIDTTADKEYICLDATVATAVWTETTAGAGGGDPDQDLWETVAGDTGSTAADTTTDTLTIAGGDGITTAMSADTLTVTNSNHAAVGLNTTHSTGDGSDHANVATNTTHSTGDGSDHANVATNTTHSTGDGSDHANVATNTTHSTGDGTDHSSVADKTGADTISGLWNLIASGAGGFTDYDVTVGDVGTPDYGIMRMGNSVWGRTSNTTGYNMNGATFIQNVGGPVTGDIEFAVIDSSNLIRFALPKSGAGNATYNPRSMLIAGPAIADSDIVTVGHWQGEGIFDNLACDTGTDGADLGVQNDLEVEGDIFTDSIKESTTDAGVTIDGLLVKDSGIPEAAVTAHEGAITHQNLSGAGTNTHAQIDTHVGASSGVHGATGDVVGTTDTQTLSAKTLTTPTIGDFTNATHDHADAAGGGVLDHADLTAGTGADHSYIDQDVTSASTPTFTGTNFTNIPWAGVLKTSSKLEDIADVPAYSGNGGEFVRINSGATAPEYTPLYESIQIQIEGTVGEEIAYYCQFPMSITGWQMGLDVSGTFTIDVWKNSTYRPTDTDSYVTPSVTSAISGSASSLSLSVAQGDWLIFHVDTATTATLATLALTGVRT